MIEGSKTVHTFKGDNESEEWANARLGYETALTFSMHMGNEVWSQFNIMVITNSIFIAVIGLSLTTDTIRNLGLIIAIIGILVCYFWLNMFNRSSGYCWYYLYVARQLEEKYFSNIFRTLHDGYTFSVHDVKMRLNEQSTPVHMGFGGRHFKFRKSGQLMISLFFIFHIVMLIHEIMRIVKIGQLW